MPYEPRPEPPDELTVEDERVLLVEWMTSAPHRRNRRMRIGDGVTHTSTELSDREGSRRYGTAQAAPIARLWRRGPHDVAAGCDTVTA